jgi:lipocalin
MPEILRPEKRFDLQRYCAHRWYEAARVDSWFECMGARNASAVYRPGPGGQLDVENRMYLPLVGWVTARGVGKVVGNRMFAVSFSMFATQTEANYVVLDFDEKHYNWTVVHSPQGGLVWVLVRERFKMTQALASYILSIIKPRIGASRSLTFNTRLDDEENKCFDAAEALRLEVEFEKACPDAC